MQPASRSSTGPANGSTATIATVPVSSTTTEHSPPMSDSYVMSPKPRI